MNNKIRSAKLRICVCLMALWVLIFCGSHFAYAEEEKLLQPIGQTVGISLKLDGVTIVDTDEFEDRDGKTRSPAKDAGLKTGDIIKKLGGRDVSDAEDLEAALQIGAENEISVSYVREGKLRKTVLKPYTAKSDGRKRAGIWVKDAVSGLGTITYIDPKTGGFVALGHGISDPPGGKIAEISGGDILKSNIVSVIEGRRGAPGELIGVFADGMGKLGDVTGNTMTGIVGTVNDISEFKGCLTPVPIAERKDVHEGMAYIISNTEGSNAEKFEVEIQKINKDQKSTKGMVIKVTDEKLLKKTGGIVQGMSGSPIIQDDHLVGAVTHVFVNDPTRGYGIFMDGLPGTN